jgi:DNA-binding transcriptional ArsR family regulator
MSPLDRVFQALASPTRRAMLAALAGGPRTVGDLAAPFAMSLEGASKHVRALERAGLVRREVVGRSHVCHLEPAPLAKASAWLRPYEPLWDAPADPLSRIFEGER